MIAVCSPVSVLLVFQTFIFVLANVLLFLIEFNSSEMLRPRRGTSLLNPIMLIENRFMIEN